MTPNNTFCSGIFKETCKLLIAFNTDKSILKLNKAFNILWGEIVTESVYIIIRAYPECL